MLTEIRKPRQIPDEPRRRWFHSADMDLIVWFAEGDVGEGSVPIAFQLCYDKARAEKALSWKPERGFVHLLVDDGESAHGKYKATPLLMPDGACELGVLGQRFNAAGKGLPAAIRAFITTKLSQAADASLNMPSSAARSNRDPDPC